MKLQRFIGLRTSPNTVRYKPAGVRQAVLDDLAKPSKTSAPGVHSQQGGITIINRKGKQ